MQDITTLITVPKYKKVTKVILVQLGSPKSPEVKDVKVFLKKFLNDPRVVDINPIVWKIILNLFVLPFRPKRSARLYARIWDEKNGEFPLIRYTREFSNKVAKLVDDNIEVEYAFLLSSPDVNDVYEKWLKELKEKENPANNIIVIPMFPQYSESTIASGVDFLFHVVKQKVIIPDIKIITQFHRLRSFIDLSVEKIRESYLQNQFTDLVISFHGIPKRRVIEKKDPYYQHCYETFYLLKKKIDFLDESKIHMTFQSRFGSEEWLTPYNEEFAVGLADSGVKKIGVYCPSFVADCLETVDEIGNELKEEVHEHGAEIFAIPCLNDDDKWAKEFSTYVNTLADSSKDEAALEYEFKKEDYQEMKEVKYEVEPMSEKAKSSLKLVFLTLFLDLIGFSIIFPLFPTLAKHYLTVDSDNYFLKLIFGSITSLTTHAGATNFNSIVLFGGALGAIYSLLQFIAAPFWGSLSDKVGRRPILLVSVFGLFLSYVLWFFSGNFTLLILARFIGGIMGGNISTATAVVADVTTKANRSKGMATIGIAFALGFIFGPAFGGIFSLIDLTKHYPMLSNFGVNPFSMAALVAAILSLFNFVNLYFKFEETLNISKSEADEEKAVRSANVFKILKPLPFKGVNKTNFGHFLFLLAFSGMEFTLTFLAAERMNYSAMDNAYMFIFIGVIIALVQGGYVRRKAHKIGEQKMALQGLISIIPGLLLIAFASSSFLLYFGLFFLAVGSSMAIPCLTSLVSLYTPANHQGMAIGVFRSLGALARVIGPIVASIIYWKFASSAPYLVGSLFMLIPIFMVSSLPKIEK